jgi:hypothetical protein
VIREIKRRVIRNKIKGVVDREFRLEILEERVSRIGGREKEKKKKKNRKGLDRN